VGDLIGFALRQFEMHPPIFLTEFFPARFPRNSNNMNISDLQVQLHQVIDSIRDEEKLEAVFTLLKSNKGPFQPMSLKEYVQQIDEAANQVSEGKYSTIDELEKVSENW
jgi:hypothetical protein